MGVNDLDAAVRTELSRFRDCHDLEAFWIGPDGEFIPAVVPAPYNSISSALPDQEKALKELA